MFSIVLSFIALFFAFFALGVTIRNEWVFKHRIELNRHENGVHLINEYIGYNEMIRKFWIWDIEKLKKTNVPNVGETND